MEFEPLNPYSLNTLPVFPLAGTVLFPGTVLPLHIFEPRYRDMVADALASDQTIALVMPKSAAEEGVPAEVHEIACAGRIIHSEKLENERYNILLQGISRVRLNEELPRERSYRRFRATLIERPSEQALEEASLELGRLQSCVLNLSSLVQKSDEQLCEVLRATSDPVQLADILGATLVSDCALQQTLLASSDFAYRLRLLIDVLAEVMARTGEVSDAVEMN